MNSPRDHIELYNALCRLLPAQFEEIIYRLGINTQYISPSNVPQSTRANEVMRLLNQQHLSGIATLQALIQQVSWNASCSPLAVQSQVSPLIPKEKPPSFRSEDTSMGLKKKPILRRKHARSEDDLIIREQVFISYSHKDKKFLDELLIHLKPIERAGLVKTWSDNKIMPGSDWMEEIRKSLCRSKVAVMMVSPSFLASDFINDHELNPVLEAAERQGVRILWIPVKACSVQQTPLSRFQAVISPSKPLAEMRVERNRALVKICEAINTAVNSS